MDRFDLVILIVARKIVEIAFVVGLFYLMNSLIVKGPLNALVKNLQAVGGG